ncbi:MAG TPA: VanZ family protein [Kiritimatiellia bacterium]|nr:VanZ family protein [Kiritimatiellia bacterium]
MQPHVRVILFWFPALLWAGVIFYSSSLTPEEHRLSLPFLHADKIVHAIVFGILSLLLWFAIWKTSMMTLPACILWAFSLAALYGILDEVHQSFVPGRDATFGDVLADIIGAILFLLLAPALSRRFPRSSPWRKLEIPS